MGDKSPRSNAKSKKQKADKKQSAIAARTPVADEKPAPKTR